MGMVVVRAAGRVALGLVVAVGFACDTLEGEEDEGIGLMPPPEDGFQINFGPFNVPPRDGTCRNDGTFFFEGNCGEVQLCRTLKLGNDEPVAINRLDVKMPPGSHHFIIFRSEHDFPDSVFPCWGTVNFDLWEFVLDVNKSGGYDWQLAEGQGFILEPHQQLMVQSHFVNGQTVDAPLGGMVTTNLHRTPVESVDKPLHGKFIVNNSILIPPMSTAEFTRRCTFDQTVAVVAMTGHQHARGLDFWVSHKSRVTEALPEVDMRSGPMYHSDNWDSPEFSIFETPIDVYRDQGLRFGCSYYNETTEEMGFGGHADQQEHCNLFFHYYQKSSMETPLQCTDGPNGK
jgi:hypothetical protein